MAEHSNTLVTVKSNSSTQSETEVQADSTEEEQNGKASGLCPLLICESSTEDIPPNLQLIIENLSNSGGSTTNKTDLLICLVYILMIETGFVPLQYKDKFNYDVVDFHKDRTLALSLLNFPDNWKNEDGLYKFEFVLTPFPEYVCKMTCVVVCQTLNVNLLLKPLSKYCINLETNRYIIHENHGIISKKFDNLNDLSIKFKDQLALPAKRTILSLKDVRYASIQELPTEIIYKIFVQQRAFDFVRLKSTCKRIQQCAKYFEHELWEMYFKRDFPQWSSEFISNLENWEMKYKVRTKMLRRNNEEILWKRRRPFLSFDII